MITENRFFRCFVSHALVVILLSITTMAMGVTYYVDDDATDNTGDGLSIGTAWKTIKYAAANVPAGTAGAPNIIMVEPGTYDNSSNGEVFPITFNNDYVSLTGSGEATTTIDAEGSGTVDALMVDAMGFSITGFTFDNALDAVDIDQGGFTISNNTFTANVTNGVYFDLNEEYIATNYTVGNMTFADNTFNVSVYGVYLDISLDFGNNIAGLSGSIEALTVNSNTFTDNTYGFYVAEYSVNYMNNGTANLGNVTFDSNTITNSSSDCIYFDDFIIEEMSADSTATVGNVLFTDNTFDQCGDAAIDFNDMTISYLYNSTGTIGNLSFLDNTVTNCGSDGFDIEYYGFDGIYDSSTATGGNATLSGNTISGGCSSTGIYFDEFYLYDISSSSATIGNLLFNDNEITDGYDGIYVNYFYAEYIDNGQTTMGNFTISNSTLTGQTNYAIYTDYWSVYEMNGPSTATLGNYTISDNTITTFAASGYGIYADSIYYIYDIFGTSAVNVGNINVTGNTVTAYSNPLYLEYDYIGDELGQYRSDAPIVQTGTSNITGNTLTSTNSEAAYLYYYSIGYDLEGDSKIYMGATNISGNTMTGDNEGLYLYFEYNGYEMVDNSMLEWKPISITNNTITSSSSDAIEIYWYDYYNGSYNEDNARMILPDLRVTNNIIDTSGDDAGLYYYNYENPYYNEDNVYVDFGSILIKDNTFNPDKNAGMDYGVYLYVYEAGNGNYNHTTNIWGDVTITDNTLYDIEDEAIYLDYDGYPYDLYDYATFSAGSFNISDNHIAGADSGIYMDFLFEVDEIANAKIGYFMINNNTMTGILNTGVYADMEVVNNDPTTASIRVGGTTIKNNMITADAGGASSGIYFVGDIESNTTFGKPVMSRNTISGFTDGIYLEDSDQGMDTASLSCNWLQNNTSTGIRFATAGKNFMASSNAITANTTFGLSVDNGNAAVVNAENNWWGDVAGPAACASCNGVNPGDAGSVDFTPWLFFEPNQNTCDKFPWQMFTPAVTGMKPAAL